MGSDACVFCVFSSFRSWYIFVTFQFNELFGSVGSCTFIRWGNKSWNSLFAWVPILGSIRLFFSLSHLSSLSRVVSHASKALSVVFISFCSAIRSARNFLFEALYHHHHHPYIIAGAFLFPMISTQHQMRACYFP